MKEAKASFNLVDEQWIKVKTLTGETVELSLLELFRDAHKLKSLANDLPTQDFAILRVLLAILQRSIVDRLGEYEYPSEAWADLWDAGKMPIGEIENYLRKWRHRFDLFDEEQPFMQVAGMRATNGSVSEIKKLISDIPDGLPLFSLRSIENLKTIDYAEAARWLIHVHAFDTSGIKTGVTGDSMVKGGKSYPIGTGWAGGLGGILLDGKNIADTLMLNLCLCHDCRDDQDEFIDDVYDLPVWEQDQKTPGDDHRNPLGYADIYTWQSRRVLLKESAGKVAGVVLTNGDKLEAYNKRLYEPMTPWRRSGPQEKRLKISPVYLPLQHRSDRAMWRGLTSILPSREGQNNEQYVIPGNVLWAGFLASQEGGRVLRDDYKVTMHAIGMEYGVQSSTVVELINDTLRLKSVLLSPEGADAVDSAKRCMAATDNAVAALGVLAEQVELSAGLDSELATGPRGAIMAEAYYELDLAFRTWLSNLEPNGLLEQESAWYAQARQIIDGLARRVVDDASPIAIRGKLIKKKIKGKETKKWLSVGKAESRFKMVLNKELPIEVKSQRGSEVV